MKKILLASTILVGTAGFAAADNANFTFSGSAYMGLAYVSGLDETVLGLDVNRDGDALDTDASYMTPEVSAEFTAGMMTTTDGGLEAGASITLNANGISVESDHTDGGFGQYPFLDIAFLANAPVNVGANIVNDASAYVSGDWGKLTAAYDVNGTDVFDTSTLSFYDVTFTYSNTWGDFGVEAYYTVSPHGESNGDAGVKGTYTMGDYSVFAALDWDADNVNNDADTVDTGDWSVTLGGSASMSGFDLSAEATYDNLAADWDWMAEAAYTTGAFTVGAFVEDDGADDAFDYGVNGSYDLGGGVSIDAAYIFDNDLDVTVAKVGVSMAF